jgi:hypothetical protein
MGRLPNKGALRPREFGIGTANTFAIQNTDRIIAVVDVEF